MDSNQPGGSQSYSFTASLEPAGRSGLPFSTFVVMKYNLNEEYLRLKRILVKKFAPS